MKIQNGLLVDINESDIENGSVTIPESVTHIGNGAFRGCTGITGIAFEKFKRTDQYKVLQAHGYTNFVNKRRNFI